MRLLIIGCLSAAILFASTAAADTKQEARDAFKEGVTHYEAGRTEAALEAFRKADELQPSWKIQYNIGQCEAALKHYGLAVEAFEAYLAGAGDEIGDQRRDQVLAELDRLRKLTGTLTIEGSAGVTILVDGFERGKTPLSGRVRIGAGADHEIVGKQGDRVVIRRTVRVGGGENMTIEVGDAGVGPSEAEAGSASPVSDDSEGDIPALEVDDEQDGLPVLFWIGAGLTVATLGAGVGFGVASNSRYDDFDADNKKVGNGTLSPDDPGLLEAKDDVETYDKLANAMFITSGVLAAATAVVLIVHLTGGEDEEPDDAEVSVTPNGLAVSF